MSSLSWAI